MEELGEDAGACLAMNSPICPIPTPPSPLRTLFYRFSHTRCQQKNKNDAEQGLVHQPEPGSDFHWAAKTHTCAS